MKEKKRKREERTEEEDKRKKVRRRNNIPEPRGYTVVERTDKSYCRRSSGSENGR
jgi:hypothetical protein